MLRTRNRRLLNENPDMRPAPGAKAGTMCTYPLMLKRGLELPYRLPAPGWMGIVDMIIQLPYIPG